MNKLSIISIIFLSGCSALIESDFNYNENSECGFLFEEREYVDILTGFDNKEVKSVIINGFKSNHDLILSKKSIYRTILDREYTLNEQEASISSSLGYNFSHSFDSKDNQDGYSISFNLSSELDIKGRKQLEKLIADINVGISYIDHKLLENSLLLTIVDYIYTLKNKKFNLEVYKEILYLQKEKEWFQKVSYDLGYEALIDIKKTLADSDSLEEKIRLTEVEISKLTNDLILLLGSKTIYYDKMESLFFSSARQLYEKLLEHDVDKMEFFEFSDKDDIQSMIVKRGDITKSNFSMCQSLALYNVSLFEFYPEITFSSAINNSASKVSKIFEAPIFGFSVGISLPFLDWDRIKISSKISKSNYESLIYEHKYNIYKSLTDIESKKIARDTFVKNMGLIDREVLISSLEVENAQVKLSLGYISKVEYSEKVIELYYMYLKAYENKKSLLIAEFEFRTALGQRVVLQGF